MYYGWYFDPTMLLILPVGGFLTLGTLIALVQYFLQKKGGSEK